MATTRKTTARKAAKKTTAKKSTAKKTTAKKTTAKRATAKRATAKRATTRKVAARRAPAAAASKAAGKASAAPPAGTVDLAGGLRSYLGAIDLEVRAVSGLSERIDALVAELNDVRDQQAKRLTVLDELRSSVSDQSLGSFLDQAIRPRKTRVVEVVPKRLR